MSRFSVNPCRHLKAPIPVLAVLCLIAPILTARSDQIRFDQLSIEDGLSQSVVTDMFQDHKGFIWVGTQDGLDRFDGYRFLNFKWDANDPTSLSENYIQCLYEDRAGFIWVGTVNSLNRYNPLNRTFERFDQLFNQHGLEEDMVVALTEDADGNLWIGTANSGLFKTDPMRRTFIRFHHDPNNPDSLPNNTARSLLIDRDGFLWVGTYDGLARFQGDTFFTFRHHPEQANTISGNRIMSLFQDRAGLLWVGTRTSGLNHFNPGTGEWTRFRHQPNQIASLDNDGIRTVLEDRTGLIWVGTDGGLNCFDRKTGRFDRFPYLISDSGRINSARVFALMEDRGGTIWVGTEGAALFRYDRSRNRFTHHYKDPDSNHGLNNNTVLAIFESSDGMVWIGTDGGGLNRFDRAKDHYQYYRHKPGDPTTLPGDTVFHITEDHSGHIWVGLREGLTRLDRRTQTFQQFAHNNPSRPQAVLSINETKDHHLWVGTYDGLVLFSPQRKLLRRYMPDPADPHSLSHPSVSDLALDETGDLWITTYFGGLNRFRNGRFQHYRHDPDDPYTISKDRLWSVFPSKGTIWIGTNSGLNRLNPTTGKCIRYGITDGLPNENIFGITEDSTGHLWMSSNKGLIRLEPESETFKTFATHDGLQSDEFAQGAYFQSPSGEMFFGGINGFNTFFPERITESNFNPPVVITDLQLFNVSARLKRYQPDSPLTLPIEETSRLTLGHKHNVLALEFAALDFANPRRNRYAYKLEGFDEDWVEVDASRRFAVYTNLDPGAYRFRVKGTNKDGLWNQRDASLQLTIRPPWWRTNLAYLVYLLILFGLGYAYIHQQNLKLERERRIAAQERHIAEQERAAAEQQRHIAEQQRQVAEKDRHIAEQERTTSQRLREIDKLKDEFLANTSHELRTPLHGIIGLSESLLDGAAGPLNAKTSAYLSMVVSSGKRLANLVNDILDFSKLKNQNLDLELTPVDFRALTDVVLTLSRPLLGTKQLELLNYIPADAPPIRGDENRLQQIMHNLIGNAVKFTHSGRIEVGVESLQDGFLGIYVEDTGIGIAEDKFAAIFAPFEQADGTMSRTHGGTGLGSGRDPATAGTPRRTY